MNIYDRIINMLLEAKVESYLERLDEIEVKKTKAEFPDGGRRIALRTQLGKNERNKQAALAKSAARKAARDAARTPKERAHAKASSKHAPTKSGDTPQFGGRPLRWRSRKWHELEASSERRKEREAEDEWDRKSLEDTEDSLGPGKI